MTFDSDWAHQIMMEEVLSLLNEYHVNSTFFITNKIDFRNFKEHELAIHPNFTSFEHDDILSKTLNFLPSRKSKGSRSHRLYHSSSLLMSYEKFGIEYDSNYFIPSGTVEPFFFGWTDVLEIPFFFSDDAFYEKNSKFELDNLNLKDVGTKSFLFHPFHIFMNTSTVSEYVEFKDHYQDMSYLDSKRDLSKKGTRTLFVDLLDWIESNNIEIATMNEINQIYRRNRLDNSS